MGIDRAIFWWRWWRPAGQGRRQLAEQLKAMTCQEYRQLDLELLANPMTHGEQLLRAAMLLAAMLGLTVGGFALALRTWRPRQSSGAIS